jgi:hypothetical protein
MSEIRQRHDIRHRKKEPEITWCRRHVGRVGPTCREDTKTCRQNQLRTTSKTATFPAKSLACAETSIGSMQVGFLMALAGVPVRKLFDHVGYWWRTRVPRAHQRAESIKTSYPGQTPKVLQVLFRRDVIEVDPPNHIWNWPEGVVLSDNALTWDSIM